MNHANEVFSEYFARNENLLTRIDARIKMVFTITGICIVISSPTSCLPFVVAFLAMGGLLGINCPFKILAMRLSAPLGIAITLLFVKIFFYHGSLSSGLTIASKIVGSTSLILFLSMTTTIDKVLAACIWFKIPKIWVEICLISYRYVFVLLEDAITIFDAQKVRLGYTTLRRGLWSIGILAGAVIVRAYDQSVATYEAMVSRGYKV